MLVLSRKKSERIRIGDDIVIELCEIRPNAVRLGITAPRSVRVLREEVPERDTEQEVVECPR